MLLYKLKLKFIPRSFYKNIQLYINTSEIPGELSRINMISSHVKITCHFHKWKDSHCYGYIIIWIYCCLIETLSVLPRKSSVIFGNLREMFGNVRLAFNSISHSFAALTREISSWTLEDKIRIHAQACDILYLLDRLLILYSCIYIMSSVELEGEVKNLTKSKSELQTSLDEWKVIEISKLFLLCFRNESSKFTFCFLAFCSLAAFSFKVVFN